MTTGVSLPLVMAESEAHLRVSMTRKRGLLIKDLLTSLLQLKEKTIGARRDFVAPQGFEVTRSRWQDCKLSTIKQLKGINQKVR